MNAFFAQIILAVVQGIAEWFPISSSSHLVLISGLLGYPNTLQFDVAVHFGTLLAVFVYFRHEIIDIARDVLRLRFDTLHGRLGVYLVIATIPAVIVGFALRPFLETTLGNLSLMAFGLGITGVALLIGSTSSGKRKLDQLNVRDAIIIGLVQVASLFRGISRSGSTISVGLLRGLDEKTAVTFSFLMSIPIVLGANILELGGASLPREFLLPMLVSFIVGLGTIHVFIRFVLTSRKNLRWFGIYVLIVAACLELWLLVR